MIFYSDKNVYEAAKDRIRWIFDEFKGKKIVVSISGGKDSTVLLYLVKEIMDERGIEKIPVCFSTKRLRLHRSSTISGRQCAFRGLSRTGFNPFSKSGTPRLASGSMCGVRVSNGADPKNRLEPTRIAVTRSRRCSTMCLTV